MPKKLISLLARMILSTRIILPAGLVGIFFISTWLDLCRRSHA
jgi:hypothetical protein